MLEEIFWILDKNNSGIENLNEKIRQNVDFVHSLNKKCDSVGWSSLDLNAPDSMDILKRIDSFCRENGWQARGLYSKAFTNLESDWFTLILSKCEGADDFNIKMEYADGEKTHIPTIKGYKIKGRGPFGFYRNFPLVSEAFRDTCLKHGIPGVDFCWVQDTGKYHAEPWFSMIIRHCVMHIACDRNLNYTEKPDWYYAKEDYWFRAKEHLPGSALYSLYESLGGYLPALSEIFYDLKVHLPDYYPAEELPAWGFAYAFADYFDFGRNTLLVHKNTASMLIQEKMIKPDDIYPVPLYSEPPVGYSVETMQRLKEPKNEYVVEMESKLDDFRKISRPGQNITDNDALKALRKAKLERKNDFSKGMPQANRDIIVGTKYSPLISYYAVADGGYISDEYRFLSYTDANRENEEFYIEIENEELLNEIISGIVFASCADGDLILLRPDGSVARFSHEVPEIIETWQSAAQFFVDNLEPVYPDNPIKEAGLDFIDLED